MPFATVVERDIVRAGGPDAASFLQGQLSQDVDAITVGTSAWSLLLAPTGKVDAWLRVTRAADDEFVLDIDGGRGAPMIERLNRFKLRTKCDIEPVSGWQCIAVRGATLDHPRARTIVWPGVDGVDLLGPDVSVPEGIAAFDLYDATRIAAGVPAMGRELTDATIPVEAGQWLIDASVSFTKGCYTGQELVARIDSRGGNAPRPVRGVRIEGEVASGVAVASTDGHELGHLTSAWYDGEGETLALAVLPRAVALSTAVAVDGRAGRVVELPMS